MCDLHKKSEEVQVNALLYAMGDAADYVMTTFMFGDEGDRLKYDKVKEKFDQYSLVRRNVIYERAKFNQRTQADETAEEFITSLHCLAEHCNFGTLKEEMIQDRIVVGVKDATLSEKMQLESTLTLKKKLKWPGKASQSINNKMSLEVVSGRCPPKSMRLEPKSEQSQRSFHQRKVEVSLVLVKTQ